MSDVETTSTGTKASPEATVELIKEGIKQVYDPEIPVNIFDLGLIYDVDVEPDLSAARIEMTLTSPNCPAAEHLPMEVQQRAEEVMGAGNVVVDIVWDPPWDQERMSEEAMLALGLI